jgi:glycerol-3-phosphate dehydrogenase
MEEILGGARFASDLGKFFGPLSAREIEFLKREEFAQTAEDILWRRSKLGLHMKPEDIEGLKNFLAVGEISTSTKTAKTKRRKIMKVPS